jgi:hypothetical protein
MLAAASYLGADAASRTRANLNCPRTTRDGKLRQDYLRGRRLTQHPLPPLVIPSRVEQPSCLLTFGFRKLSDLVRKTNAFEIEHPKGGSMRIRTKSPPGMLPKPKTANKVAT